MKNIFNFDENNSEENLISEINITPLVDVMLILMVIFLVTAPLMINDIKIKLPKAIGAQEEKTISKTISITEDGKFLFESKETSLSQIQKTLKALSSNSKILIKIAADKNSRYSDMAQILSILNKSKISNISFLTQN